MKKELINTIEQGMLGILNNEQLAKLHEVLEFSFAMFAENYEETQYSNDELLKLFLSAKQVEGCSERSLKYYRTTLSKMNEKINKSVRQIETNDIRTYISNYENETSAGKVTLDNIRRIISSFFAWLEDENYIVKSPARRIHKIRVGKTVKDVYSDEELERMRDSCNNSRDLAIIDILSSTGIRVGELVNLNISDIDLEKRIISISKSYQRLDGKDVITPPKTPKSNRKITIPPFLVEELKEYCSHLYGIMPNERMFRFTKSYMEHEIVRGIKETGVKRIRIHDLRHSHASLLVELGFQPLAIAERLGHEKIETTLNTYSHLYPNKQAELANRLELENEEDNL